MSDEPQPLRLIHGAARADGAEHPATARTEPHSVHPEPHTGGPEPHTVRPEPVEGSSPSPLPHEDANAPRHYWAFLSYSHHDKVVAKKLQRQLETYRVPRRLVGRETAHGRVPARVAPVFRDRDELHAGADLKASVQDALARSRWLIVICTPDAARSPWVNREIIEFKRLHGERQVLALIAAGEPFASDMPGCEAQECFPPALRRALNAQGEPAGEPLEPLAADMRAQGDGPQRAALKLLAGMVGVGFDELVRRDLQRRMRWLSAIAAASVLGLLAFAGLAVLAMQARNEAQTQRAQAEGLIEFMLGDLRKKLEPVGRLEVLDSVGEKVLAYYGAQQTGQLDPNALGQRSRALHLIGEIRDLRGNPAEALAAFEQAASTTERLLAQAPNDGQRIFDHAQSVFWVGDAALKRGDGKLAEAKFEEYLALAERLVKIDPGNVDWLAEVAYGHTNVGGVQLGRGHPTEALKSFQRSGVIWAELLPLRHEFGIELVRNHAWQADAYELLGDYEQALAEQQSRLSLLRSMPGAEKDRGLQRDIVNTADTVSEYQLALGQASAAEISGRAAVQLAGGLVNADPSNMEWLGDACIARLRLVEVRSALGQPTDAQVVLKQGSDCVARINARGSLGLGFATMRIKARSISLAAARVPASQRKALADVATQFLDQAIPKLTPDVPDRARLAADLANLAVALGEMQAPQNIEAARSAWQRAEELMAPYAGLQAGAVLAPLARARYDLGDTQGAEAVATRIQQSSYRHPAYADLAKQLQAVRGGGRPIATPGVRP